MRRLRKLVTDRSRVLDQEYETHITGYQEASAERLKTDKWGRELDQVCVSFVFCWQFVYDLLYVSVCCFFLYSVFANWKMVHHWYVLFVFVC